MPKKPHPGKKIEVFATDGYRIGLKPMTRRVWAPIGDRPIAHGHRGSAGCALGVRLTGRWRNLLVSPGRFKLNTSRSFSIRRPCRRSFRRMARLRKEASCTGRICATCTGQIVCYLRPGRKAAASIERARDIVLTGAAGASIERPKKQSRYYSDKKKRHTLKTRLVAEKPARRELFLAHAKGPRRGFRLFTTSKVHLHRETKAVSGSGCQRLPKRLTNMAMPEKREPNKESCAKTGDRAISSECVACANAIAISAQAFPASCAC